MTQAQPETLGLYIHWPFCLSKCPYCDFNSHVRDRIDQDRWRRAYLAALDRYAQETKGRPVSAIFFGGGTPSLMNPGLVAAILDRIATLWPVSDDAEITLEANPTSVEAERIAAFRAAGVSRVSLGVQALDDSALRALGRGHDRRQAIAALDLAARHFDRFSFDLIYARPEQTVAAWESELNQALDYVGDHLSVYQLTIEPGTAFANLYARGDLVLPDEDRAVALYETTQTRLADAGLLAYEVSNHARPGGECRHNLVYWRGDDYLGIGPGAHGRLTLPAGRFATQAHRAPEIWLQWVEDGGTGEKPREVLDPRTVAEEMLLMGLRLTEGVDGARFRRRTGLAFEDLVDPARLDRLTKAGLVDRNPDALKVTAAGRTRLDAVVAALLT